jgi:hypothetical protein
LVLKISISKLKGKMYTLLTICHITLVPW